MAEDRAETPPGSPASFPAKQPEFTADHQSFAPLQAPCSLAGAARDTAKVLQHSLLPRGRKIFSLQVAWKLERR